MTTLTDEGQVEAGAPDLVRLDETAFERLYSDHVTQVTQVVRRYLWGTVVDDVVQETFAQAYRSGLHLEAHPDREGWLAKRLCGIARNRSIDVLRFRMRGLEEVPDDGRMLVVAATGADHDPERQFQAGRRREGIAEALEGLGGRQRRMLVLHYVEGRSYDEIAQLEGMSIDAVKSTLARGRRTFRDLYATIADRKGLSVVLGGLLARVQARMREAAERVGSGLSQAAGTVTAATPAVSNAVVAAFVVGGLAVGGMAATVTEAEAVVPIARAEAGTDEPADETEGDDKEAAGDDEGESEPESEPRRQPEPEAQPEPEPEPEPAPAAQRPKPKAKAKAAHKVDSDEVDGSEQVPGEAEADTEAEAEADAEEGTVEQAAKGDAEAIVTKLDGGATAGEDVSWDCANSKYSDPVTDTACGAVTSDLGTSDPGV